jgi:hypothetical protein
MALDEVKIPQDGATLNKITEEYWEQIKQLSDIHETKLLIMGQSCDNCKHNGLMKQFNVMKIPECYRFGRADPMVLSYTKHCKYWVKY